MGKYKHPVPGFFYFMVTAESSGKNVLLFCYTDPNDGELYLTGCEQRLSERLPSSKMPTFIPSQPYMPPAQTNLTDFISAVTEENDSGLLAKKRKIENN